jgi:hypothetical protein
MLCRRFFYKKEMSCRDADFQGEDSFTVAMGKGIADIEPVGVPLSS